MAFLKSDKYIFPKNCVFLSSIIISLLALLHSKWQRSVLSSWISLNIRGFTWKMQDPRLSSWTFTKYQDFLLAMVFYSIGSIPLSSSECFVLVGHSAITEKDIAFERIRKIVWKMLTKIQFHQCLVPVTCPSKLSHSSSVCLLPPESYQSNLIPAFLHALWLGIAGFTHAYS